MSCLHLRSTSTALIERFHRTIVMLTGILWPVAERARYTLSDGVAVVRQTLRQLTSHLRIR